MADRAKYDWRHLRYVSDLTDAEWAPIETHIPTARRGGRRRAVDLREVLQGVRHVLETSRQLRHLPTDFPPRSTASEYLDLWRYDGGLDRIHETLSRMLRGAEGRGASPAGRRNRLKKGPARQENGFDAGKKTKGVRQRVLVDTLGGKLRIVVHPASVEDRAGRKRGGRPDFGEIDKTSFVSDAG